MTEATLLSSFLSLSYFTVIQNLLSVHQNLYLLINKLLESRCYSILGYEASQEWLLLFFYQSYCVMVLLFFFVLCKRPP